MLCIYKRIGNSVIAPVVCKLAKELVRAAGLSEQRQKKKKKEKKAYGLLFLCWKHAPLLFRYLKKFKITLKNDII